MEVFFKAVYGKLSKRQQYRNWCDQKFRKQEWMQVLNINWIPETS